MRSKLATEQSGVWKPTERVSFAKTNARDTVTLNIKKTLSFKASLFEVAKRKTFT